MPNEPRVTIVVPTRNRDYYLPIAIDSVLSQDYPSIECIVMDAASTDRTVEILKGYGDRITWRSRPDRGPFDAINEGWQMGSGEILAWVNSDDFLEPGAVRAAVDYFLAHPDVDVMYGTCRGVDRNGDFIEDYPPVPWDLRTAVLTCDHILHQIASFMRRGILEKVGYLYPAWNHDHDLWLRIALAGGKFGWIPQVLGDARIWPENMGYNPKSVVKGKVGLTERFFARPDVPPDLKAQEAQAMAAAYLRCLDYIPMFELRIWPTTAWLIWKAFRSHPGTTLRVVAQRGTLFIARRVFKLVSFVAARLGVKPNALSRALAGRLWPERH